MRVMVACDPPLLSEVVTLALSRIDGVELAGSATPDVLVTSDRAAAAVARTIVIDDSAQLADLVDQLSAWVFQSRANDFPLLMQTVAGDTGTGNPRNRGSTQEQDRQDHQKEGENGRTTT